MRLDEYRTARMLLRRMRLEDFADLLRMYQDPVVMATLGGVRTAETTRRYLDLLISHWETHGFGWWTMRDPATGRFIGRGGLRRMPVDGREQVEVGYGLVSEYWGRGLATELARECVRIAFAELQFPELVSFTLPTNLGSRRVMEKAGFRYDRDIVHADLPHVLYRQTATEWRQEHARHSPT